MLRIAYSIVLVIGYTGYMANIYHMTLMDHYRYPRNKCLLAQADFVAFLENVHCGDRVTFAGSITENNMTALTFDGTGCVLSQAIASLMTEKFVGYSCEQFIQHDDEAYIRTIVGTPLGPTRLKCALLPLQTLRKAIITYQKER